MTRRSRREIERAVEDLATDAVDADAPGRCDDCGRLAPGVDETMGVTVDWVTYECTERVIERFARSAYPSSVRTRVQDTRRTYSTTLH